MASDAPSGGELSGGWSAEFHRLDHHHHDGGVVAADGGGTGATEGVALVSISLSDLFANDGDARRAFTAGVEKNNYARAAQVALADYAARALSDILPHHTVSDGSCAVAIQTMGQYANRREQQQLRQSGMSRRQRRRELLRSRSSKDVQVPYVLERTDCAVITNDGDARLQMFLHATLSGARRRRGVMISLRCMLLVFVSSFVVLCSPRRVSCGGGWPEKDREAGRTHSHLPPLPLHPDRLVEDRLVEEDRLAQDLTTSDDPS